MNMNANSRTSDVLGEAITFDGLLLPTRMVENLTEAGYHRPSPVQHAAIPLARLGTDLIIQAKAGTGKTLVFAIASVERVDVSNKLPQVLILAPTREVALQASDSILDVAGSKSAISTVTLIGGLPTAEDERVLRRKCHIVVGTPGRMRFLVQRRNLLTEHIGLLVLDEADKLLAKGHSMRSDVESILAKIPSHRQTIAVSATFSEESMKMLYRIMKNPYEVRLSKDSSALIGVSHYYFLVDSGAMASDQSNGREDLGLSFTASSLSGRTSVSDSAWKSSEEESNDFLPKLKALSMLLTCASFHQAVVFCNSKRTASMVSERLRDMGISVSDMSSSKNQLERIRVMNDLRDFVLRVVVATDVAARGVDLEGVNMVVNFDVPEDPATLAHRLGRAGRFGTYGCAVSLVYSGHDGGDGSTGLKALIDLVAKAKGSEPLPLPRPLPPGWKPRQFDTEKIGVMIQSGTIRSSNGGSVMDGKRTPASVETSADSGTERSVVQRDAPGCFDVRRAAAEADVEIDVCEESEERGQDGDLLPFEEVRNVTLWPKDVGDLPRPSAWPLPICALERNFFVDTCRPSEVEASPLDMSEGNDLSGHRTVHVASGDSAAAVADADNDDAGEEDIEIPYSVIPKDKDMKMQAAKPENEDHHYNQVVESARLDLHREHKKSMQGLENAFKEEETRRNVPSVSFPTKRAETSVPLVYSERNQTQYLDNAYVVGRHRRPLGTTQSAAYAQHIQEDDLAAEAEVLERLMLEDAQFENKHSFEPLNGSDEYHQDTEDAWRQYWLQHYEAYGYYPGGQPPTPTLDALQDRLKAWDNRLEGHGYVSVPAQLLVRYVELEKWYKDQNEKALLPSGMMDTTNVSTRTRENEGVLDAETSV